MARRAVPLGSGGFQPPGRLPSAPLRTPTAEEGARNSGCRWTGESRRPSHQPSPFFPSGRRNNCLTLLPSLRFHARGVPPRIDR